MTAFGLDSAALAAHEPWFRRFPGLSSAVAGVLFAIILVLRLMDGSPSDAISMLYALPVALLAVTFGLRAGAAAGVLAVGLTVLWVAVDHVDVTPIGWASRIVPMLLIGVLIGQATDHARRADRERRRLEGKALLHREAIEINDSLVQGMAAAKWSIEGGRVESGTAILEETMAQAQDLVSGLIRRADMGSRTHHADEE